MRQPKKSTKEAQEATKGASPTPLGASNATCRPLCFCNGNLLDLVRKGGKGGKKKNSEGTHLERAVFARADEQS